MKSFYSEPFPQIIQLRQYFAGDPIYYIRMFDFIHSSFVFKIRFFDVSHVCHSEKII